MGCVADAAPNSRFAPLCYSMQHALLCALFKGQSISEHRPPCKWRSFGAGTVSKIGFTDAAATVACRQAGLGTIGRVLPCVYGLANTPIW